MDDEPWKPRVYSVEECEAAAAEVLDFGASKTTVYGEGRGPADHPDYREEWRP